LPLGELKSLRKSWELETSDYDFIIDTNLKGAWRVATLVARHMVEKKVSGSIVNIASILGLRVGMHQSIYAISKAGVVQMTNSMALELGRKGVRVNALCPGYFKTEMNGDFFDTPQGQEFIKTMPAGRIGELHELDGPLLLLCSEAGSFMNGVSLPVDGGHLVSGL
jgi:NAD(P)-dependent dehydrogenase (short-subunit alcohol dehydrogenase family)